ncbi:hypothetical protein HanIR_Chr08g0348941 [Helianthus annuus]|nr:hypothetical protein HanIR_Chr08g0348941 [Helianthus annuus]
MSVNTPCWISSPILSTACFAVDPVPNPITIPDLINSTALYAAIFFNSSCAILIGVELDDVVSEAMK